ncbi:MAG TPA: ribonuclease PH [Candidatus Atribacteria bacterium]|nr:ribonuclease PH [Candidatus Atribacteria bacterium]
MFIRKDARGKQELRKIKIIRNYNKFAEGSVLFQLGDTIVLATASIENKVPPFLKGTGTGWITAEYSMLPRATKSRNIRDSVKGFVSGRSHEIQRIIGRSLRTVIDLRSLGERTIWIDCDILQADGGTRTASINAGFLALVDASYKYYKKRWFKKFPVKDYIGAISVGIVNGERLLDLSSEEDNVAQVDMNISITGSGKIADIQATAEGDPFSEGDFFELLKIAKKGINLIIKREKDSIGEIFREVGISV